VRDKPINLNLFTLAFPVTAIASILHRMSGLLLFLLIPIFLGLLQTIIFLPEFFSELRINKLFLIIMLSILAYHLLAGVRHLLMDCGFGESKRVARISAYIVIALSAVIILLMGWSLCC